MPLLADRVQETTTTGGTGTITLGGAVTGYRTFAAAFSVNDILYYTIDNGAGEWEVGSGTLTTTGTLSRDSVLESSNSNALVNFSSGTKRVFCSAPTKVLLPNETGNAGKLLTTDGVTPSWTTTLNGMTIGNTTAGSGAFTTLSASSTVSGTGFSTYLASPPAIGGTAAAAGAFTTLSASSTVSGTGFSTYLASPPAIGGTTASTGRFTTIQSTIATGTAPFTVASTTNVANLNASSLNGATFAAPGAIGSGTAAAGTFTSLTSTSGSATFGTGAVGAPSTITINGGTTGANGPVIIGQGASTSEWFISSIRSIDGASVGGMADYVYGAYPRVFYTNGTERARINASGLGIGTSSPACTVDAAGTIRSTASTTPASGSGAELLFISGSSYFLSYDRTTPAYLPFIFAASTYRWDVGATTNALVLNSSGLGVGAASSGAKVNITCATNAAGIRVTDGTYSGNITPSSLGGMALVAEGAYSQIFYVNGATRAIISSAGVFTIAGLAGTGSRAVNADASGNLSAASDSSLKQEDKAASIPGLTEILKITPRAYKWLADIENRGDEAVTEIGFFADEVAPIIPSAAPKCADGLYGFYDRSVIAALVKSTQELSAEIETLKQKVN